MARTIFDPAHRDALLERLGRLQPDAKARWGKLTAHRMVCDLADAVRVELGEIPARRKQGPLAHPMVRWLVAYVIPFPKGKAETAPEMLTTQPADWPSDLAAVQQQLRAAAQRGPHGEWAAHPAFGDTPGKLRGVFIHKHFDHHLRQFGV